MRYASAYRIPDHDDRGAADQSRFLRVNSVGYYEFDEPWGATIRPKGRRDFYLAYSLAGNMSVHLHGQIRQVGPGQAFLYKPGESQHYGQADEKPISNYWIHFTGYGVLELLTEGNLMTEGVLEVPPDAPLTPFYEDLIDLITRKPAGYEMMASSCLMRICALLSPIVSPASNRAEEAISRVQEGLHRIHRQYGERLRVTDLAACTHLSVSHFSSLFKQATGFSPQRYLLNFRLDKAVELMRHTRLNIRQVASLTGFDDPLYFSRYFRKRHGLAPREYQDAMLENGHHEV